LPTYRSRLSKAQAAKAEDLGALSLDDELEASKQKEKEGLRHSIGRVENPQVDQLLSRYEAHNLDAREGQ